MTVVNYEQYNQLLVQFPQLIILGFPCPQFYNQEPGKNSEILNCLKFVRPGSGYVPHFTLFEKTNVNGDPSQIHPVYNYLRAACDQPATIIDPTEFILWSPVTVKDITWNFEKFLITRQGYPYKRYTPQTNPVLLVPDIQKLLAQK